MRRDALVLLFGLLAGCGLEPASIGWPPSLGSRYDAVFHVTATCSQPNGSHIGTAFAVSPHLLVTAKHLVVCPDGATADDVRAGRAETELLAPARIVARAPDDDVAVLSVDKALPAWLAVAQSEPDTGELVCAITRAQLVKCGHVFPSGLSRVLAVGIRGVPGNSGSPLLDARGYVVGVLSKANMGQPGIEDVVSAVTAKALLETIPQ